MKILIESKLLSKREGKKTIANQQEETSNLFFYKIMINSTVGVSLTRETLDETFELLEEMSLNVYHWKSDRPAIRIYGNHNNDIIFALSVQMEALGRKMDNLNAFHTDCQISDSFIHYSNQANFVGDFQEHNNFQKPSYLEFAP